MRAVGAARVRGIGVAAETAALHHVHRRQQPGQPADQGRLGGALLAADQDPADRRGHRVEQQRQLEVVHPGDCGERERRSACAVVPRRAGVCRHPQPLPFPGSAPEAGLRWPEFLASGKPLAPATAVAAGARSPVTVAGQPRVRTGFLRLRHRGLSIAQGAIWPGAPPHADTLGGAQPGPPGHPVPTARRDTSRAQSGPAAVACQPAQAAGRGSARRHSSPEPGLSCADPIAKPVQTRYNQPMDTGQHT